MPQHPVDALDDAVHEYMKTIGDNDVVSGWVIAIQSAHITDDPNFVPLQTATTYSMSPSTTGESALGMLQLTSKRLERAILSYDDIEEEEEEEEEDDDD